MEIHLGKQVGVWIGKLTLTWTPQGGGMQSAFHGYELTTHVLLRLEGGDNPFEAIASLLSMQ